MKTKLFLVLSILLFTRSIHAQKHEIGIGFPSIGFNGVSEAYSPDLLTWTLFRNSEINNLHMHTWRDHSIVSPIVYYSRKLDKRICFRTSLSFQKEFIVHHFTQSADAGDVSEDFDGRYSQLKLAVGISYFLKSKKQSGFYLAADFTQALKHIYEKGSFENWAWGYTYLDYSKKLTMYCLGVNPSVGYKTKLSPSFSFSYEVGFEYSHALSKSNGITMLLFNPLNRLSINYRF